MEMPAIGTKRTITTDSEYNELTSQQYRTNTGIFGWITWEMFPNCRIMIFTQF